MFSVKHAMTRHAFTVPASCTACLTSLVGVQICYGLIVSGSITAEAASRLARTVGVAPYPSASLLARQPSGLAQLGGNCAAVLSPLAGDAADPEVCS